MSTAIVYTIDADDCIVSVNDAWDVFAEANDGAAIRSERAIGNSLWHYVSDASTVHIYRLLVARVRKGAPCRFRIRCDSPDVRRTLSMTLRPHEGNGVQFVVEPVHSESRDMVPLLDVHAERDQSVVTMCGWCNRLRVRAEEWTEIEHGVHELALFDRERVPHISHGMCQRCYDAMVRTIDDMTSPTG